MINNGKNGDFSLVSKRFVDKNAMKINFQKLIALFWRRVANGSWPMVVGKAMGFWRGAGSTPSLEKLVTKFSETERGAYSAKLDSTI